MGAVDLLEQPHRAGCLFDHGDDVASSRGHLIERVLDRLRRERINIVESYKRGDLEVVLRLGSARHDCQHHLILRAVPSGWKFKADHLVKVDVSGVVTADANRSGGKGLVLVGVAHFVHGPEGVIPSFVWIKRSHDFEDFLGQVLRGPGFATLNFSSRVPEGEVGVFAELRIDGDCDGVSGLIERGAHAVDRIEGSRAERVGQWLEQLDLMNVDVWKAELNDLGVWVTVHESSELDVEILDVSLGVLNAEL